jgi:hypothetical protein
MTTNNDGATTIDEFLEEVLEERGLSITDEEGVNVAVDLYQRWIAAEDEDRITEFDYEILSVFSLVSLFNDMTEKYHEEYTSLNKTQFPAVSFEEEGFTKSYLADRWSRIGASDEVVLFFTLAHEKIEQLSERVFENTIIDEEFEGSSGTGSCIQSLSQPQREQLLLRTGTIDSGLHSKMKDTREIRNDLLHNLKIRYRADTERDVQKEGKRAVEAINQLYGMTSEYETLNGIINVDEM